jgi:hypothetical protein
MSGSPATAWQPLLRVYACALAASLLLPAAALGAREFRQIYTAAAVKKLIKAGNADSLAAAALLKQLGSDTDTGAYALTAKAVALAPKRADLAWLAVRMCDTSESCDPMPVERHLREVDPGNAAGWIGQLGRAQRLGEPTQIDAALDAIGKAQAFRVYFEPLVVATTRQLIDVQRSGERPSDADALASMTMTMIGVIAGAVLPGTRIFSFSCQGYELQINGRPARCMAAARTIERSDAYIVEGLGLSLQQKLSAEGSAEHQAVARRREVFQYRLEQYNKLNVSSSRPDEFPPDYLQVAAEHPREQDVALFYFGRAQVAPDPPAGWVSTERPRVP